MTQGERRVFLINYLLNEIDGGDKIAVPGDEDGQKTVLRSLLNVREAAGVSEKFLSVQDEYLKEAAREKGVTKFSSLTGAGGGLYLWQGDITALECGAVVNAANSGLTGCYCPMHGCIDNQIHTYAGVQLRLECAQIMEKQRRKEKAGGAKITKAYNLPCKYVIHTVGPFVSGEVTPDDRNTLASCYKSCLTLADGYKIDSVAFCCISTGEFHFPHDEAAQIAVKTVREYKNESKSDIGVIFNVYKDRDYEIYKELLGKD